MVPLLFFLTGKAFGVSSSLRHACAAVLPSKMEYLNYDWRAKGLWNLVFVLGILIGGFIGGSIFANPNPIALSESTVSDLSVLGISNFDGLVPAEIFSFSNLLTLPGFIIMVVGGFLVGFGARYAGGCTSGHAITGLSNFQKASLFATVGFFIGGLIVTYFIYPILL